MMSVSISLAGVLLVLDVFLPQLLFELRIRLLLRGLAQPLGDDVVIAAVGNLFRRGARAAARLVGVVRSAVLVGFEIARARGRLVARATGFRSTGRRPFRLRRAGL